MLCNIENININQTQNNKQTQNNQQLHYSSLNSN